MPEAKSRQPEMQVNEHEPLANTPIATWNLFPEGLKAHTKSAIIWAVTHRLIPRWAASALIQILRLRNC